MKKAWILLLLIIVVVAPLGYASPTVKNWTFLFFENGNNNLDRDTTAAIRNLEKVGSDQQINVVVQWASLKKRKAVRMLLQKSNNPGKVTSPVLQDLGLVDMGDSQSLKDFLAWGVANFPAKHYFIVVSDHGKGWHDYKIKFDQIGDISVDDISGHMITTEELGDSLRYAAQLIGHEVDVYASDACYMAMIDVANEMAGSVKYFLGSEETEPGEGWPYTRLLKQWEAVPNLDSKQLAKILVDTYGEYYKDADYVTYSAFDMSQLNEFNQTIAELADAINGLGSQERVKALKLAKKTQFFTRKDYRDLLGFAKLLANANLISTELMDRLTAAAKEFIIDNAVSKRFQDKAYGVSIWLPITRGQYHDYLDRYQQLSFDKKTHWDRTLSALLD